MIKFLLALMLSISPYQRHTVDYVDIIETNHSYKNWIDSKTPTFSQYIYKKWKRTWHWSEAENKKRCGHAFEIVDWRALDKAPPPKKNWRTGRWEQTFYDKKDKCERKIIAIGTVTSHTVDDPEVEARKYLPPERRIKLSKPREQK